MTKIVCVTIWLAMASIVLAGNLTPAKLSEHRTPYHDPAAYLAGTPKGDINDRPQVRSHVSLGITAGGGSIDIADVTGDGVAEVLHVDHEFVRAYDLDGKLLWDAGYLGFDQLVAVTDIDADGRMEIVLGKTKASDSKLIVLSGPNGQELWRKSFSPSWMSYSFEIGKFDSSLRGQQIFVFYSIGIRNYVECFTFERGAEHGQMAFSQMINRGSCVGAPNFRMWDFDGDGNIEPVSLQHHSFVALNIRNGNFKFRVDWQSGGRVRRNYGPCYPADFNGDGQLDFVVYGGSVEKHITVVQGGNDRHMLWTKFLGYVWKGGDEVKLGEPRQPPLDFDGDGKLDLLYTTYGLEGDNKHRLFLVDPMTGEEKLNLIRQCTIAGAADVDGDGVSEALLSEGEELVAYGLQNEKLDEVWRAQGLQPILRKGRQFSTYGGGEAEVWGMDLNADGIRELFMQRGDECVLITCVDSKLVELWKGAKVRPLKGWSGLAWETDMDGDSRTEQLMKVGDHVEAWHWRWEQGQGDQELTCKPQRVWPPDGVSVSANKSTYQDIDGDGTKEIVTLNQGTFSVQTVMGRKLHAAILPSGFAPKIKDMYRFSEDEPERLVVQGPSGLFKVFVEDGKAVAEPTKLPPSGHPRGVKCDLDGDGRPEYVESRSRTKWLAARRNDGTKLWTVELPGKRYGFWVGRFLGRNGDDVVVTYPLEGRDGRMVCYDGATGKKTWAIDRVVYGPGPDDWRSPIGNGFIWDADSNGTDDVFVICNDTLAVVDGRDGSLVAPAKHTSVHWSPGIHMLDIDGDDVPAVLVANPIGAGGVALHRMDTTHLWDHPLSLDNLRGAHLKPADTNGDGKKELGIMLNNGVFECWDATTGKEKWTIQLGTASPSVFVNAADIDGDGNDEFIMLGADRVLYCLKEINGKGETSWIMRNPGVGWSNGRLFDFDNDGLLEIVLTSLDGRVSVLE